MSYLGIQYSGLLAVHLNYEFGFHVSFPKNQTDTKVSRHTVQVLGHRTMGCSTDHTRFWTTRSEPHFSYSTLYGLSLKSAIKVRMQNFCYHFTVHNRILILEFIPLQSDGCHTYHSVRVCTTVRFTHRVYLCVLYDLTTNSTSGPEKQRGLSPIFFYHFLRKCTVFPRISSSFTHRGL
jgi:hypothetical protein